MASSLTIMERLLSAVEMDPNSGCWLWFKAIGTHGYGALNANRRASTAHRLSWIEHFGPIPDGQYVLHRCDTKPCINPAHLFLGTQLENLRDMRAKGRDNHYVGERAPTATITTVQARAILAAEGTGAEIARRMKIAPSTVYGVRARRTWRHI